MIIYKDKKYNFFEIFNEENGTLYRSNIKNTIRNPKMRSFPELIDIGIMGSCYSGKHGFCRQAGIDCYQQGDIIERPNMSLNNYINIIKQCARRTFQVALGGAGDPNKHPQFEEILQVTRQYQIIPNLTTSGYGLSDDETMLIKKYCGAIAVSWYSRLGAHKQETNKITWTCVNKLIEAGCCTNIHFVISNDTIDEAIYRLKNNLFPSEINAIIFLLYKPVGHGISQKIPQKESKLREFVEIATLQDFPYRIGFDTCFTPILLQYASHIPYECIESCEAATFSMYIDSELNCFPCSFDCAGKKFRDSLIGRTIEDVWNGSVFNQFRKLSQNPNKLNGRCKLDLFSDLYQMIYNR